MPKASLDVLDTLMKNNYPFTFEKHMFDFIKYRLITNCINFNNIFESKEGIDNKLLKEIYSSSSYEELIFRTKSKRYTYTKISRLLSQIFLCLDNYDFNELIKDEYLYARVLGFNSLGRNILKEMKKNSNIPIITKVSKNSTNPLLNFDIQSTKAYSILNTKINPLSDYLTSPIIKN